MSDENVKQWVAQRPILVSFAVVSGRGPMKRILMIVGLVVLGVLSVAGILLFGPWGDPPLISHSSPATSYDDALSRIAAIDASELDPRINPERRSIHLLHGSQVETAVVLFHGYTSSPPQFALVAKAYFDAGYNVWVPLAPAHGYVDRLGPDLSNVTVDSLRTYADGSVDIARGLGRHVIVAGLSGGGAISEWLLSERPDVEQAIAISPFLQPIGTPRWQIRPLYRATRLFDATHWWDAEKKQHFNEDNLHSNGYPRTTYRGLAAYMTLGQWATDRIRRTGRPATGKLTLVVNEADHDLDGEYNAASARGLAAPDRLTVFRIPKSQGFDHDIVDPWDSNKDRMGEVYVWLSRALGVPLPDPMKER
jgi:pimeloyl-ACP methyl ester carboxylesterase